MSKLEPQVGDRVTVTHDPTGNTLTGEVSHFRPSEIGGLVDLREFDFCLFSERGWRVTEVHERQKPKHGTFVKGVTRYGNQFRGVVYPEGVCGTFRDSLGTWVLETWKWEHLASWEVVQ